MMLTLIITSNVKSYTKKKTKQVSSPLPSESRGPDSDVDKKHQYYYSAYLPADFKACVCKESASYVFVHVYIIFIMNHIMNHGSGS